MYLYAYEAVFLSEDRHTLQTAVNNLKYRPTENKLVIDKNNIDIKFMKRVNPPFLICLYVVSTLGNNFKYFRLTLSIAGTTFTKNIEEKCHYGLTVLNANFWVCS
jgi:hypothetical protein